MNARAFALFGGLSVALLLGVESLPSQTISTGTIRGRVTDWNQRTPLLGANVLLVGTTVGTTTDLEGRYMLRGVEPGPRRIRVSYVGYERAEVEIDVEPGGDQMLDIVLKQTGVEGEEVVVTAQRTGQQGAINQQITSRTIVNVVAADRLQENPDANAAEALGRLPGLSLIRSGGEGVGIVIRGMDPSYSEVTINGIPLPSTSGSDRSTNISGISQFSLQTAEVIKAKTPDMDGNSVAGTINLELGEAPDSLISSVLVEGGFNNQNDYWGNYRVLASISDRLFDKRLGVRLNAVVERVNRSTETMSAGYLVSSNVYGGLQYEQVLLNSVNLNAIERIPDKQTGTLVLDYAFSSSMKITSHTLMSRSGGEDLTVTKYSDLIHPVFNSAVSQSDGTDLLFSTSVKAQHTLPWADIGYGIAFSQTHNYAPRSRSWTFITFGGSTYPASNDLKKLSPQQVLASYPELSSTADSNLARLVLYNLGYYDSDLLQKNVTPFFDIKVPLRLGEALSGYVKGGGKFNYIGRTASYISASQYPNRSSVFGTLASTDIDWVQLDRSQAVVALGMVEHHWGDFLGGQFPFGWYPNMDRLNQVWDWWNDLSNSYLAQGPQAVISRFGSLQNVGFVPDVLNSSLNEQSIIERYLGGYLMCDLEYENLITMIFGARYEKVTDDLRGHFVEANATTYGLSIPGSPEDVTRSDEFWLPMVHLRFNPTEWMKVHLGYTQALSRPDFSALMPNTYYGHTYPPYSYITGNPYLKPELWKSYDLQLMVYGDKVGLFSVSGFFKEVRDKIWQRSFTRIPGDPIVPGFAANDQVQVTEWSNHEDPGFVKGVELEWQTNFWYLPSPFNHFSLNVSYTLLRSEQQYPTTRVWTTVELDSITGKPRPKIHRVDSSSTDNLLNQPDDIVNASLGFNYKGFNAWLSFQFNGMTLTGWTRESELIPYRSSFYRWDFQVSQKLPLDGLEVLFNVANISNHQQESTMRGDPRPTYVESYGWTSDLGLRYRF
jgi:TonB-dependent receptor